ncbi:MAG: signal peptidase II [Lewinellaceae bacterium]|nr:signal peptidase II [Lewinella sp.]MCB9278026.1 signal peptidase II [Lewinellaceae bacterium]
MKSNAVRILAILVIIAANISCDQVSKNIVRDRIGYNETIPVIARRFTLTKVENTGAFLSLGDSLPAPVKTILLFVVPMLALVYGLFYLFTAKNLSPVMLTAICFLIGGGLGNIFDRALYGSVTDFLHIDFGLFQTGIFNMADVSVMVGVFTILLYSYFFKKPVEGTEVAP